MARAGEAEDVGGPLNVFQVSFVQGLPRPKAEGPSAAPEKWQDRGWLTVHSSCHNFVLFDFGPGFATQKALQISLFFCVPQMGMRASKWATFILQMPAVCRWGFCLEIGRHM